jgi:hypothetical protein
VVALDDDALSALWGIFDATGIRPEYLIPVLYFESAGTFSPAISNLAGAPYYGLAQTSAQKLAELGTTPAAFLAMTQGAQIRLAIAPYFAQVVRSYGPIRSATRAYQANFEPATLAHIRSLSQIVDHKGTRAYADNARALDPLGHGAITLSDLALVMSRAAAAAPARAATSRAYALRPSAAPAREPVYGDDFINPGLTLGALAAIVLWQTVRRL